MKKKILILIIFFIVSGCNSNKSSTDDFNLNDMEFSDEFFDDISENSDFEYGEYSLCDPNPCENIPNSSGECEENNGTYLCGCLKNYSWSSYYYSCDPDRKVFSCLEKPLSGTEWNAVSEYPQEWSGTDWVPPDSKTEYNEETSFDSCRYKCSEYAVWVKEEQKCRLLWEQVATGEKHTCAINQGKLYCWGSNFSGILGDGTECSDYYLCDDVLSPLRIGTRTDWSSVSSSYAHTCGIAGGELFCWGINRHGQFGDGTTENKNVPVKISDRNDWKLVSTGEDHTCGIASGELFCWGYNHRGQLGDGTSCVNTYFTCADKHYPVKIGEKDDWDFVSAGKDHTCAISNGELFCWGSNRYGQLGDGTYCEITADDIWGSCSDKYVPVKIGDRSDWEFVSATGYIDSSLTCGIAGGELFCWGNNRYGLLGDQSAGYLECYGKPYCTNKVEPFRISEVKDWEKVVLSTTRACGIAQSKLFCWGNGAGDGSTDKKYFPTRIGTGESWDFVYSGINHNCGIAEGELFCWGSNNYGQLGDGTTEHKTIPMRIK